MSQDGPSTAAQGPEPSRPQTPPHHPTYNVHLPSEGLEDVVQHVWPAAKLVGCEPLAHGKSFNNRIYFLIIENFENERGESNDHYVMKLNGRHRFGHLKVMNEVAILLLLKEACPNLPAPRLVAWSIDGKSVETRVGGSGILRGHGAGDAGWILMERLSGRSLEETDLTGEKGSNVIQQLGDLIVIWRKALTFDSKGMGSLRMSDPSSVAPHDARTIYEDQEEQEMFKFMVSSPWDTHRISPTPLLRAEDFYLYYARDQLEHFKRSPHFANAPQREETISLAEHFIHTILPSLACWKTFRADRAVLTHKDLSPRNILVEPDPDKPDILKITGIVDWEFAGLLPEVEEWLNCEVSQRGDWSEEMWTELLRAMDEAGVTTLEHLGDDGRALKIMREVIDAIAPWYVQEGATKAEELVKELEGAHVTVRSGIEKLEALRT